MPKVTSDSVQVVQVCVVCMEMHSMCVMHYRHAFLDLRDVVVEIALKYCCFYYIKFTNIFLNLWFALR